jgi:NAD(P)-dependent dehydrogenase (short-subunit alcohol dehydrogenase family)
MPEPKPCSLSGRVAVITGSSRGIGYTIAETFGRAGARVVISSSRGAAVEQAAAQLCAQGVACIGIPCDVSDLEQVQRLLAQVLERWDGVDIWVNNAGISGPFAYTLDVPPTTWERVLRTNVLGCYYGCITVLPHMLQRRYGKIINLSGGGAQRAQPYLSAYSSSKAAVVRLTDGLAREYGTHRFLSINVLEPGLVATDMIQQTESIGAAHEALNRFPRILRMFGTTAEETAALALRMVSRETDGVSGKTFSVMPRHRILWRLVQTMIHIR